MWFSKVKFDGQKGEDLAKVMMGFIAFCGLPSIHNAINVT
jgi:hypothetical protein